MFQSQINNLSPPLPACWGGSKPGAPICDDCIQDLQSPIPTPHPWLIPRRIARITQPTPSRPTRSFFLSNSQMKAVNPVISPSTPSKRSFDAAAAPLHRDFADYTPSTVLESVGRTPAPMATPPKMSFSDTLAYIDEKLLQLASHQRKSMPFEYAPRFPPGLAPNHGASVDARHSKLGHHIVEMDQARQVLQPLPLSGARRSHSKMVREENENSPPDVWSYMPSQDHEQPEPEHNMKRRKLIQHDSTVSAHNFVVTEPASLRKAKSLRAGDIEFTPQQLTATSAVRSKALPIAVPTIWPEDAALIRLRNLAAREAIQRADDLKHMLSIQQPSACKFDLQMYIEAVDWILSVHAPGGDFLKPLRRHLRSSLETRFHAVWLFSRYASRLSSPTANPFLMPRQGKEASYQRRIRARLVREVALGCLAIAAKFHHDFLPPLLPLTVEQFRQLVGEDYPVTFDDFELVQSAVLKSFNYIINQPTPHDYLEEIWKVCPTLQIIQDGSFDLPRSAVRIQAIELIETCLIEREIMDYPVSSLTAASLLESLHICELHQQCDVHSGGRRVPEDLAEEKPPAARVCAGCVNQEISNALQLPRHALDSCRDWIMAIWTGEE
ncbi:hypothetical protein BDV93DRAFT_509003 [Ceratobasidium sp. AG-I]|nr:hypothetical protein BDV93DRAFT_509003 [Ceratobasidium sp. AG-I]